MIVGVVSNSAPRITIAVRGERDSADIDFIVDTGYTGFLSLPKRVVDAIGAEADGIGFVSMADGSFRHTVLYVVQVEWDGDEHEVQAVILEDHPLIGFKMLDGYHLSIEMREEGEVTIEEM